MDPSDAMLAFLPPAHVTQRVVIELLPILCGVPVWFAESLKKLPQEFARVRPTIFVAPPRFWERIHASIRMGLRRRGRFAEALFDRALRLATDARAGRRLALPKRLLLAAADRLFFRPLRARFGGRLRVCGSGAAPLGKDLAEFFLALGLPLIEGYGITEAGVVILNPCGQTRPGSIGKPLQGIETALHPLRRSAASQSAS